jgi:UDP-GlcNAc:undecaprenyl-phosphate GlcNAc-1-phosphate transferase
MNPFLYVYGGATLLVLVLTPGVIWLARRIGAVDPPGPRGVHQRPVPRMGGVAIFLAAVSPLVISLFVQNALGEEAGSVQWQLAMLLCASALVFVVGLVDDLRHLPARFKLVMELLVAGLLCFAGVRISSVAVTDQWVLHLGGWGSLLTVLWIVGVTNAVNLSDGLDGLAAGICALACGVLAVFALWRGDMVMVLLLLALLGSLGGFLIFNFNPARVFMGDSGSLFLGFTIGACSVMGVARSGVLVGLTLPALALGIPLFDMLFSALRRFLEGRSVFAPDRGHFHHRLLDLGLPQRQAVLLIYLATLLAAGLGLLMLIRTDGGSLLIFLGGLLLILSLFRAVGAIRLRQTLTRLRQKYAHARQARDEQRTFERLQLHLRWAQKSESRKAAELLWGKSDVGATPRGCPRTGQARGPAPAAHLQLQTSSFFLPASLPWQAVCTAAEQLELAWVSLQTTSADGRQETSIWRRAETPAKFERLLTMSFPLHNVSGYRSVEVEMAVLVNGSLESANHRASLFVRLAEECLGRNGKWEVPSTK